MGGNRRMAIFTLSAFADEYSPIFDEQIKGLRANGMHLIELRGIDEINISDLSDEKAREVKAKLDVAGIGISALGSPIGKIRIDEDFEAHKAKLRRTCEIAGILGAKRIRMFSFFMPEDCADVSVYREEVMARMGAMLDIAEEYGVQLCHENEKGIYGDTPERCLELLRAFPGRLGCVFDPANFIQVGAKPFPDAYMALEKHVTYVHIKDCAASGTIVLPGYGVGGIPEMFAYLNRTVCGEIVVTMEPHLKTFAGLSALEGNEKTKISDNVFATNEEAFTAAADSMKMCMPKTAVIR